MSTYALTGTGTQTLSAAVVALHVTITTLPTSAGHGFASPLDYWGVGLLRPGDASAFWDAYAISGGPQWLPLPWGCTRLGYALLDGAAVSVAEVFAPAPLAVPLALSPDVALASLADAQVLTYQASSSKWINATPAGGGGGGTTGIGAHVYRSTSQSIGNTAYPVAIAFDTVRFDTNTMWSSGANTRLTAHTAGIYLISATLEWAGSASGTRQAILRLNGSTLIGESKWNATSSTDAVTVTATTTWNLAVSDYVEVIAYQASGSSLSVNASPAYSPEFSMVLQ